MKISIGINIFKKNKRQDLAIDCLRKLKSKNKNIELYNISFEREIYPTEGFIDLPTLSKKSHTYTKNESVKKPIANEFFDILSETDCDCFLFLNSDILLTQSAISLLNKGEYESYIFSRHEISDLNSIEESFSPYKIEVAGFDAWAVKTEWWKNNKNKIPTCIYSEVAWDNIMSLCLFTNSKSILCNKQFLIGHLSHPIKWSRETPEGQFNLKTWYSLPLSLKWDYYLQSVLFRRLPVGQYLNPLENEVELEHKILKS